MMGLESTIRLPWKKMVPKFRRKCNVFFGRVCFSHENNNMQVRDMKTYSETAQLLIDDLISTLIDEM